MKAYLLTYLVPGLRKIEQLRAGTDEGPLGFLPSPMWPLHKVSLAW